MTFLESRKKLWNIRVTVISKITGVLGIIPKILKRGSKNWRYEKDLGLSGQHHC